MQLTLRGHLPYQFGVIPLVTPKCKIVFLTPIYPSNIAHYICKPREYPIFTSRSPHGHFMATTRHPKAVPIVLNADCHSARDELQEKDVRSGLSHFN